MTLLVLYLMRPQKSAGQKQSQPSLEQPALNIEKKLAEIDEKNQSKKGRPFGNEVKEVKYPNKRA